MAPLGEQHVIRVRYPLRTGRSSSPAGEGSAFVGRSFEYKHNCYRFLYELQIPLQLAEALETIVEVVEPSNTTEHQHVFNMLLHMGIGNPVWFHDNPPPQPEWIGEALQIVNVSYGSSISIHQPAKDYSNSFALLQTRTSSNSIALRQTRTPSNSIALRQTRTTYTDTASFGTAYPSGHSPAFSVGSYGSPASFMTTNSRFNSPATFNSPASFVTAASSHTSQMCNHKYHSVEYDCIQKGIDLIQLSNFGLEYQQALRDKQLSQDLDSELNWSGKGQHVVYSPGERVPLKGLGHLGASASAYVDKVLCRRVALARKTMRCTQTWPVTRALHEVQHLHKLRHAHIIQLVGSYLEGRKFSILMYPAADCHLGTFLEDTTDIREAAPRAITLAPRLHFLESSLLCLASALAFVHKNTTKHMDVKPQNILVKRKSTVDETFLQPSEWTVYLSDFGLSRSFAPQDNSQTDGPTGRTPKYCAPEVYDSEAYGRASDIFSLGCVFAEIQTVIQGHSVQDFADFRRGPLEHGDDCFRNTNQRVRKWLTDLPNCPAGEVTGIITRMIDTMPARRPTAAEVLTVLGSTSFTVLGSTSSTVLGSTSFTRLGTTSSCCDKGPEPYVVYKGDVPSSS